LGGANLLVHGEDGIRGIGIVENILPILAGLLVTPEHGSEVETTRERRVSGPRRPVVVVAGLASDGFWHIGRRHVGSPSQDHFSVGASWSIVGGRGVGASIVVVVVIIVIVAVITSLVAASIVSVVSIVRGVGGSWGVGGTRWGWSNATLPELVGGAFALEDTTMVGAVAQMASCVGVSSSESVDWSSVLGDEP
jgi:hypothetical protein